MRATNLPRLLCASVPLWFNFFFFTPTANAAGALKATHLQCEYLTDPLGLDIVKPRLSWIVESTQRNQKQTAYRVLVAADTDQLAKDKGDLWDSGKVASDDTTAIEYAGKALTSHQYCYWKVQVWDAAGQPSEWTPTARWSMGLLKPEDWQAEWIGFDKIRDRSGWEVDFAPAKWIWHAPDKGDRKPKCQRLFITSHVLESGEKLQKAELLLAADDSCRFVINGQQAAEATGWKAVQPIDVTKLIDHDVLMLKALVDNKTEGPAGLLVKLTLTTDKGTHVVVSDDAWVSCEPFDGWQNDIALTKLATFPHAATIANYGNAPWGKATSSELFLPPTALLRTEFTIEKPIKHATLYATALGIFDVYLNGKRITEDRFSPGWSDYPKHLYYRAYDLTDAFVQRENALGVELADGWYSGYVGYGGRRDHYGTQIEFLGQLVIEYQDGKREIVAASGAKWKATVGARSQADFLMGESDDGRENYEWYFMFGPEPWRKFRTNPGYSPPAWDAVSTHKGGSSLTKMVSAYPGSAVKRIEGFRPKSISEPSPGTYVCDLGQNIAGVAHLRVHGEPGQKIQLRYAERLNPDGTIYTTNLRGARATDNYVCSGADMDEWEPRFTFHGFQYVEITGLKEPPTLGTITGIALGSDTPRVGSFECSDPMLNQLASNVYWTQRANFIEVPTDCPQRDERLGWTGDAQAFIYAATLTCDVHAFFNKWLVDLSDGQRADGQFPMVAPLKVAGDDGGPAWADAGVICPWAIYEAYGDRRVLARQYPSMVKFIEFCRARSTPELLPPPKYHCFGDWLNINAETPHDVIYMAYFARSTAIVAQTAEVLGKTDDAKKYRELFEKIKAAFNAKYVAPDGRVAGNTQTAYVLALCSNLLDAEHQKLAAKYLTDDIAARGNHLSTGFVGTKDLMLVLSQIGRPDVAYTLLHNDTFPSWGFTIKHGATSIWERWDGWTPEKGFQDPGMNSFAHYAFGAVYQWMVENIGGIRNGGDAYKKIVIAPVIDPKLTWAETGYRSARGEIRTRWEKDAASGALKLKVTIPANTTATVSLPALDPAKCTESGQTLSAAPGVSNVHQDAGMVLVEVTNGVYEFGINR